MLHTVISSLPRLYFFQSFPLSNHISNFLGGIHNIAFIPNSYNLLTCGDSSEIDLWNFNQLKPVHSFEHTQTGFSYIFHFLFISGGGGFIHLNSKSNSSLYSDNIICTYTSLTTIKSHESSLLPHILGRFLKSSHSKDLSF